MCQVYEKYDRELILALYGSIYSLSTIFEIIH